MNGACSESSLAGSSVAVDAYACTCDAGWEGVDCDVDIAECASAPCENGGVCTDSVSDASIDVDTYSCGCAAGWEGENCSGDVDECSSYPCQNGSACVDGVDAYSCDCVFGWEGEHCEIEILVCDRSEDDCADAATCSHTGPGLHSCECWSGYVGSGQECTDVDECASDPCEHGARCVESSMGLIISGYIEGSSNVRLIELFNPTCDSIDLGGYGVSMITNGGSLDSASTLALSGSLAGGGSFVICHSGQDVALYAGCDMRSAVLEFNGDDALALMREGQVVDVIGEAGIDPGRGWSVAGVVDGTRDHTLLRAPSVLSGNADWSSSQASEWVVHGGERFDLLGARVSDVDCTAGLSAAVYTCLCEAGYEGYNCDTGLEECSSSPCQNGGNCVDGVDAYECECVAGWSGPECQTDVDECSSAPCENGGVCAESSSDVSVLADAYSCTCVTGWEGEK